MHRYVFRCRWLACISLVVAALPLGCGGDDLGTRYPVSGTITYNNAPVPKGTISFTPDDPRNGRPASGRIENGKYVLGTAGENDGALPGSYKIRILAIDADYSDVMKNAPKGASGKQDDVLAATAKAKKLIPAKYELESTSNLTATVEPKSNTIDFNLTD